MTASEATQKTGVARSEKQSSTALAYGVGMAVYIHNRDAALVAIESITGDDWQPMVASRSNDPVGAVAGSQAERIAELEAELARYKSGEAFVGGRISPGVPQLFPNPLQINLGEGRIAVDPFGDDDGAHGLILRDSGEPHEVGEPTNSDRETKHFPEQGEIYIRCANRESALVLMEQVCRVVAGFTENRYTDDEAEVARISEERNQLLQDDHENAYVHASQHKAVVDELARYKSGEALVGEPYEQDETIAGEWHWESTRDDDPPGKVRLQLSADEYDFPAQAGHHYRYTGPTTAPMPDEAEPPADDPPRPDWLAKGVRVKVSDCTPTFYTATTGATGWAFVTKDYAAPAVATDTGRLFYPPPETITPLPHPDNDPELVERLEK